ncbi:MAG: NAD(+) kinase [Aphanocapsa feldmannii 277cV]|uniref:NAD kinase n=2 Tax=Aphanocapsa feldmannii TaxID=192050 RepID=A0A524RKH0_9CHRO|nr:MAG: NAD(+) kinase [Aphanocapsa feldmannii 288cV]TGG90110.1 MAG: NAD(+) kinase [Aphanocapsa feldmannii 277cV]TGH19951.1 MAG: NAD(+) kinase [Aphanocapsa feldmannii 277cI]
MQLSRVWLICRSGSSESTQLAHICRAQLEARGCDVEIATSGLDRNPYPGLLASAAGLPDLAVVLGGDGTVLGAARHLAPFDIPLLAFNIGGHLGFLTHDPPLLRQGLTGGDGCIWQRLEQDRFALERPMLLQAAVDRGDGTRDPGPDGDPHLALNDFYLRPGLDGRSPTIRLELAVDGEIIDHYQGDGLIVATPTGSTSYTLAAGGPILHPAIDAIVVSPICAMSLSSRPIVLPPCSELAIGPLGEASRRVKLWKDGAYAATIAPGQRSILSQARQRGLMVVLEQQPSYFRTLRRKLGWAGSIGEGLPGGA